MFILLVTYLWNSDPLTILHAKSKLTCIDRPISVNHPPEPLWQSINEPTFIDISLLIF